MRANANNVANKSKAINRSSSATTGITGVNKTTTKQVSNNKVDSKSKIKEPLQQQIPNTSNSKKELVEISQKEITRGLGGRKFNCKIIGVGVEWNLGVLYFVLLTNWENNIPWSVIDFIYRNKTCQDDNI